MRLNLGCGTYLVGGFTNVDKYFTLEDLKSQKGLYMNAVIEKDAEFVQADICDLPFEDNCAEYIECIDVVEHLPYRTVQKAFDEMARVLKPGGKLCLLTTNFDNLCVLWLSNAADVPYNDATVEELTQLIYGNQVGPGEFHVSPFNPRIMKHYLDTTGLEFEMTMYPYNTTKVPPMQTQDWPQPSYTRSDMMWVEATKPNKSQSHVQP